MLEEGVDRVKQLELELARLTFAEVIVLLRLRNVQKLCNLLCRHGDRRC